MTVLAGTGEQWMQGDPTDRLSSPWAVAWWQDRVWIAMAGIHQLWTFDPATGAVEVAGGTTNEGLLDGPLAEAWFAQTSGLAADGDRLWLADSETSSLRYVEDGDVHTVIGEGLFDFGFRDGPAGQALLQHPLGVTVLPDGSVAVSDTYNGAIRRFDPATGEVTTLASGLAEPSAAYVDGDRARGRRVQRAPADPGAPRSRRPAHRRLQPHHAATGHRGRRRARARRRVHPAARPEGRRPVRPAVPAGRRGDAARAAPRGRGSRHRPHPSAGPRPAVGEGVLHVAARAASCDVEGENAACHIHQQDWGVPIRILAAPTACSACPSAARVRPADGTPGRRVLSSRDGRPCGARETICVAVHDHLRGELAQRPSAGRGGRARPRRRRRRARHAISAMTLRQNDWTLGVYCQTYCRVVTIASTRSRTRRCTHGSGLPTRPSVLRWTGCVQEHLDVHGRLGRMSTGPWSAWLPTPTRWPSGIRAALAALEDDAPGPPHLRGGSARRAAQPARLRYSSRRFGQPSASMSAMPSMVSPISTSSTCQARGRASRGEANRAPKPEAGEPQH